MAGTAPTRNGVRALVRRRHAAPGAAYANPDRRAVREHERQSMGCGLHCRYQKFDSEARVDCARDNQLSSNMYTVRSEVL